MGLLDMTKVEQRTLLSALANLEDEPTTLASEKVTIALLMEKIVHVDDPPAKPLWLTEDKGYNYLPEPFVPCSMGEWLRVYHQYSPQRVEHRQIIDPRPEEELPVRHGRTQRTYRTCQIFWFHTCAFAMFFPDDWGTDKETGRNTYFDAPFFYRIGCDHTKRELNVGECRERNIYHAGNCYHVYVCTQCGLIEGHDTSD